MMIQHYRPLFHQVLARVFSRMKALGFPALRSLACVAMGLPLIFGAVGCNSSGHLSAPSGLTYATTTAVYTKGVAITANLPATVVGTVQSYSVDPALPAGLVLATSTGGISGTPTAASAAATYTVTASNSAGSTSATLTITVNDAAPSGLSYGVGTAFYTSGVAISSNSPTSTGGTPTSYSVNPALPAGLSLDTGTGIISGTPTTVTVTTPYIVTAANATGNTAVALAITVTSAPVAPTITTPPAAQSVTVGDPVTFTVVASGTAPLSYQWNLNGSAISGATAAFYTIGSAQTSNAGSYTVTVSNGTAPAATSSAAVLTVNAALVAPTLTTYPADQSVVTGSSVSFSVVATGSASLSYQWHLDNANVGTDSSTYGSDASTAIGSHQVTVTVSNSAGSVTSNIATLTVTAAPVAPTITTPPAAQSVTVGDPATFTVVASGTAPLSYQWYLNGSAISGANADFYSISSAQSANAGSYTVTVSNGTLPAATSTAVTLTVNAALVVPTISTSPASLTVTEGQAATFTVSATGSSTLHYQWQDNGVDVGTDSDTYTLALPRNSNSGDSITVTVSNTAGSVTSTAVALTVDPLVVTLASSMPLNLTPISAGTFTMGQTAIATPVHQVTISQNFYMGTYLVTQAQWKQVIGSNPSGFSDVQRPVEEVSYTDITAASTGFLALLNANATVSPAIPTGYVFRLPTEAEWEYACRAGTTTAYFWGDSDTSIDNYAWYSSNSSGTTHPVGMLLPNAWGLYDMAGNVCEWCQDWYGTYDSGPDTDPTGPTSGSYRVLRGSSWANDSGVCRSAYRSVVNSDGVSSTIGFRVVLAPPRTP